MQIKNLQKNRGFVILFAVTLSAIILSIALGVANISFKEIRFGTSAKDTNEAFFAADSGAEAVLFNDKYPNSLYELPVAVPPADPILAKTWPPIIISGLGSEGEGCAIVSITKRITAPTTIIISKGYNNGGEEEGICAPSPSAVEREIYITY